MSFKSYQPDYNNGHTQHEPVHNLLYCLRRQHKPSDRSKSKKGRWLTTDAPTEEPPYSNVFIWDIQSQTQIALWDETTAEQELLHSIFFEKRFDAQNGSMVFNQAVPTVNNEHLAPRALSDALLLTSTPVDDPERVHLWRTHKKGHLLQRIAVLPAHAHWHIDVGNQSIRVLHQHARSVSIEEFSWVI